MYPEVTHTTRLEYRDNPPPQLEIYPLVTIPHKSRKFRAILYLSFKLLLNGFEMPSLNEETRFTAKKEVVEQLGKVLPIIIAVISEAL